MYQYEYKYLYKYGPSYGKTAGDSPRITQQRTLNITNDLDTVVYLKLESNTARDFDYCVDNTPYPLIAIRPGTSGQLITPDVSRCGRVRVRVCSGPRREIACVPVMLPAKDTVKVSELLPAGFPGSCTSGPSRNCF